MKRREQIVNNLAKIISDRIDTKDIKIHPNSNGPMFSTRTVVNKEMCKFVMWEHWGEDEFELEVRGRVFELLIERNNGNS